MTRQRITLLRNPTYRYTRVRVRFRVRKWIWKRIADDRNYMDNTARSLERTDTHHATNWTYDLLVVAPTKEAWSPGKDGIIWNWGPKSTETTRPLAGTPDPEVSLKRGDTGISLQNSRCAQRGQGSPTISHPFHLVVTVSASTIRQA